VHPYRFLFWALQAVGWGAFYLALASHQSAAVWYGLVWLIAVTASITFMILGIRAAPALAFDPFYD
jgi:hypothetical protein